jgi:hypothetical protein
MAKAIAFMLLLYFGMALAVGILAGGGGYAATSLTSAITAENTTLPVVSTGGFLSSADYVELSSGEKVLYTGTTDISFTGCSRGYEGTTSRAYPVGTMVYTTSASTVNDALGFNIAATVDSMGLWSIITVPFNFLIKTVPHLLIMPYQLFRSDLIIIATILVIIQVAIVITIAMQFIGTRRV